MPNSARNWLTVMWLALAVVFVVVGCVRYPADNSSDAADGQSDGDSDNQPDANEPDPLPDISTIGRDPEPETGDEVTLKAIRDVYDRVLAAGREDDGATMVALMHPFCRDYPRFRPDSDFLPRDKMILPGTQVHVEANGTALLFAVVGPAEFVGQLRDAGLTRGDMPLLLKARNAIDEAQSLVSVVEMARFDRPEPITTIDQLAAYLSEHPDMLFGDEDVVDPWGNRYEVRSVDGMPAIASLGDDGKPGGEGLAADIVVTGGGEFPAIGLVTPVTLHFAWFDGRWYLDPAALGHGTDQQLRDRLISWDEQGPGGMKETNNLRQLMQSCLAAQARLHSPLIPRSEGKRFWIALCIGDGEGGRFLVSADNLEDQYLSAADIAPLLRSPFDDEVGSEEEIRRILEQALADGNGAGDLADDVVDRLCSYFGPTGDAGVVLRDFSSPIVGISGTRDGKPIMQTGFSCVTTSYEAYFVTWEDAVLLFGWPAGTRQPLLDRDPLTHVTK